ncbi:hypothetical protein F383_33286 [Gossypium arboreum]|uniref:Uncharacterized protein n=1 Tax=Gossypium arboreum TaxID=29729 RepID=A0A0B0N7C6_GOSAR|nr:hypothetical protein F383_33286 [Gossypium arboreum]
MVLHVNHMPMSTSQMWSSTKKHIISYVMTWLFGRRYFVNTFSDISCSTHIIIYHCSIAYRY